MIVIPLPMAPPPAPAAGASPLSGTTGAPSPSLDAPDGDAAEPTPEQAEFAAMLAAALAAKAAAPLLGDVAVPAAPTAGAEVPALDVASVVPVVAATAAAGAEVVVPSAAALAVAAEPVVDEPPHVEPMPTGVADVVVADDAITAEVAAVNDDVPSSPEPGAVAAPEPAVDAEPAGPAPGEGRATVEVRGAVGAAPADAPGDGAVEPGATSAAAPQPGADADTAPQPAPEVGGTRAAPSPPPAATRPPDAVVPQAATTTARPVAPQPHAPIVTAVTPLLHRGDGSYHLSVTLHPAELGQVEVDVELRSGEVNLRIVPVSETGREAIRAALPALRAELETAGVQTGTFDLGDRPSGETPDGGREPSSPFARAAATTEPLSDVLESIAADGAVDIRL